MIKYDFAIIGAGPAGSNFARLAARSGYRILLVDGQTEQRRKPCGGLLAPDAQTALAEMDLTLPASVMVDPQIFSVKTMDLEKGLVRYYRRQYLNIDRLAFDRWLLSLIPENVTVISGFCRNVEKVGDGFRLTVYRENAPEDVFSASVVVGADGANSLVRRTFYGGYSGKETIKRYTAIQQWFHAEEENPFYACIFDHRTSPVYSFSAYKNGKMLFGGLYEVQHSREMFEAQKKRIMQLSQDQAYRVLSTQPICTEACMVCRPRYMHDFITGKDGAYLIGEAAGFISPSSFEGISYALYSSKALAEAVCSERDNSKITSSYRHRTRSLRLKLLGKCVKRIAMYEPILRSLALHSGLCALPPFDEKLPKIKNADAETHMPN